MPEWAFVYLQYEFLEVSHYSSFGKPSYNWATAYQVKWELPARVRWVKASDSNNVVPLLESRDKQTALGPRTITTSSLERAWIGAIPGPPFLCSIIDQSPSDQLILSFKVYKHLIILKSSPGSLRVILSYQLWPEPRTKVRHPIDWVTQGPLSIILKIKIPEPRPWMIWFNE